MKPMNWLAMQIFVFFLTTFSLFAANDKFSIGSYNVENLWDLDAGNTPGAWRAYLASLPDHRRAEMGHRRLQYSDYSMSRSNWYQPGIFEKKTFSAGFKALSFCDRSGLSKTIRSDSGGPA